MITARWICEDTLLIEDTKPRLTSLTIYNGTPSISLCYITPEDKRAFVQAFSLTDEFAEAACEYCREIGWKEPD